MLSDESTPIILDDTIGPSMVPESDSPRTPLATPSTGPSAPHSTGVTTDQFSQLFEILISQVRMMFGDL